MHKSEDGKLAVIGFLFVEGEESKFLAQVTAFPDSRALIFWIVMVVYRTIEECSCKHGICEILFFVELGKVCDVGQVVCVCVCVLNGLLLNGSG